MMDQQVWRLVLKPPSKKKLVSIRPPEHRLPEQAETISSPVPH
jgi:hypothetical protein